MIEKRLKIRIIRMNLVFLLPILLLFCAAAISTIFSLMRQSQVRFLTSESYMSQIYLMDRLNHLGTSAAEAEELSASAPVLCSTLAEISSLRVQLFSAQGELMGDSFVGSGTGEVTQDVYSAAGGIKAYLFFVDSSGHPFISFSSPVYGSRGETIGVVRYLTDQGDLGILGRTALVMAALALMAAVICYMVSALLAGTIARPILSLRDALRKMEEGKGRPVQLQPSAFQGEFKELETAFVSMEEANRRNMKILAQEKEKQNIFFNSATHQLKTPLTSIIGYSEIIQRMSRDEDITLSAKYIQEAGQHLLAVVENIINISRFQRTEYEFSPTWFQLGDLCEECRTLLLPRLERSGIALACHCIPTEVYYDRDRIKEVLLNLLDNCILHSGCTQITITSATLPVRLTVEDNGCGIDEEQLDRIFQPFYRSSSSPGGSGLGLSICREIMKAQGGDVEILSAPGSGTKVILYFQDRNQPQSWYGTMARRI